MSVVLNNEGFEPAMVNVARTGAAAVGMTSLSMNERHEAHVVRQFAVLLRPEQQVPVVRHDAPAKNAYRDALLHFSQHTLESHVVAVVVEDPALAVGPIEHVVDEPSGRGAHWPWHGFLNAHATRMVDN